MKTLVAIKRVIDYNVKIRVKADHTGVESRNVKHSINPFDEIALEEAIRCKEAGKTDEIIVASIGGDSVAEILRSALAMGADRAIQIKAEQELEPLHIAKLLQKIVEKNAIDLVLLGKQAIDNDCNQTGQILAALLNWPQACFASEVSWQDDSQLKVSREVDGGIEILQLQLPAVITADLRLNQPRYVSLPNIMQAKRKPLEVVELASFGLNLESQLEVLQVTPPPARQAGKMVPDVASLIKCLQEEAKVI